MPNRFDAIQKLTHSVSVYVPSTDNVNKAVDNTVIVDNTLTKLSALFGGCTAHPARGSWLSDNVGLVVESVTICESFASSLTDESLDAVYAIAQAIKADMHQENVSVEIDNELYFV